MTRARALFSWRIVPLFLLTGVVLYLLYTMLEGVDVAALLSRARWSLMWLPVVLLLVNQSFAVTRWRLILRAMGHRITLGRAIYALLSTWPLAVMTPSRASDFLRALCIKDTVPLAEGAGSVLAEKLVDIQSLCLLAIFGAVYTGEYELALPAVFLLVAEWVSVLLLIWQTDRLLALPLVRKLEDKLRRVLLAFRALAANPISFVLVSLSSLASWLCATAIAWSLLLVLGQDASLPVLLATWPLATFVGLLPITVAGMGTRDAAFVYLMGRYSPLVDAGACALASLGYALLGTWLIALLGLPFFAHLFLRGAVVKAQSEPYAG